VWVPSHSEESAWVSRLRRGRQLEVMTLGWNVVGVVILGYAAIVARSVALAGFGLDSVIEIGASRSFSGNSPRSRRLDSERRCAWSGGPLSLGVLSRGQSTIVLVVVFVPTQPDRHVWTAMTAVAMSPR